jgi:hypothetical protein
MQFFLSHTTPKVHLRNAVIATLPSLPPTLPPQEEGSKVGGNKRNKITKSLSTIDFFRGQLSLKKFQGRFSFTSAEDKTKKVQLLKSYQLLMSQLFSCYISGTSLGT